MLRNVNPNLIVLISVESRSKIRSNVHGSRLKKLRRGMLLSPISSACLFIYSYFFVRLNMLTGSCWFTVDDW